MFQKRNNFRFHGCLDDELIHIKPIVSPSGGPTITMKHVVTQELKLSVKFSPHYHPYIAELRKRVEQSFESLQAADTDVAEKSSGVPDEVPGPNGKPIPRPLLYSELFTDQAFGPVEGIVEKPYPVNELDFGSDGAYSVYNWELFYHAPFEIAVQLSKNQRYDEAQRWFHYIFDPMDSSSGATPQRFWHFLPFRDADVVQVASIVQNLSTSADPALRDQTVRCIEAWKSAPFRPHVIARYRHQAYMYKTVMAYLDNLIAWGDSLFSQDTGESVDEAMMLYVLAADILGPRPQPIPSQRGVRPRTYANLRSDLSAFGDAMSDLESELPADAMPFPSSERSDHGKLAIVRNMHKALYFGVPYNDRLLQYWDTVSDRLFKIRNSLNLQGTFRRLPLFEPKIDPALLARAAAAGIDVQQIANGTNQPLPLVRFQFLIQKATEMSQEVKTLGNSILSYMEKEDAEALSALRSKHEKAIMAMNDHVRFSQLQEAKKSREGLEQSLALAIQRYTYYERQLGRSAEEIESSIPELGDFDRDGLDTMKPKLTEPIVPQREIEFNIAQDLSSSGGKIVSSYEAEELFKSDKARKMQDVAKAIQLTAKALAYLPDFGIDIQFWGLGSYHTTLGGEKLSRITRMGADIAMATVDKLNFEAGRAGKFGSFARREQDWAFQSNLAAGEISQVYKQLRAAQIREAIADWELKSHRQQMANADEIDRFLNAEGTERNGKKSNKALYAWLRGEVKGLYGQCYQLAFELAKKAERALQCELGDRSKTFVQYGHLSGKEGLLAGEKLFFDLKRMESAYHDLNSREYELTKHVSLRQLDPLALMKLRTTGACATSLPESLFDLDAPGTYFRRIKSVALSVPCVIGPYASVNCRLTLTKSRVRISSTLGAGYTRQGADDRRFNDYSGSVQSVITSSAQNDSGMFETNLHDERYLPFEGSGAVGDWLLQLPANPQSKQDVPLFDYGTISDVILHIRYTAREGGECLRQAAKTTVAEAIAKAQAVGSVRLLSARHDFPDAWQRFKAQRISLTEKTAELKFQIGKEMYPYWSKNGLGSVEGLTMLVDGTNDIHLYERPNAGGNSITLKTGFFGNALEPASTKTFLPKPDGDVSLHLDDTSIADLWLLVAGAWRSRDG